MKKWLLYFGSALLAAVLLFSVEQWWNNREQSYSGRIATLQPDEEQGISAVIIQQNDGKMIGFYLDDRTWVIGSDRNGLVDEAAYRKENLQLNASVDVISRGRRSKEAVTIGSESLQLRPANIIHVWSVPTEDTVTLSDGTVLQRWAEYGGEDSTFCLSDGTELLHESYSGLVGSYYGDEDLPEGVWERIEAYYSDLGKLYDIQTYLELAWATYQDDPDAFFTRYLDQATWVTEESERYLYCSTELFLPTSEPVSDYQPILRIFDKSTGEEVDLWSLFTQPEAQIRRYLETHLDDIYNDPAFERYFSQMLQPDLFRVESGGIKINLPLGGYNGELSYYQFFFPYEDLEGLIRPEAIPFSYFELKNQ